MEISNLSVWFFSTLGSTGTIVLIGYLCRDILLKYYDKKLNTKFEKEIEEFKRLIREKETQLALINNYLTNLEIDRSKVRNEKQLVAAEDCLRVIKIFNKLTLVINLLQYINFKKVFSEDRELELKGVGEQLYKDCKIEDVLKEIKESKDNFIDLYLDSEVLNNLRILQGITMFAIILIVALKDGTTHFLKKEDKELIDLIIFYLPDSKELFEKYGDEYMFNYHNYFSVKTLNSLRNFVHGGGTNSDIINIQKITMSASKIYSDLPNDLKLKEVD